MTFIVEVLKKDTQEVFHVGEFEAPYQAVACAKRAIDAFLLREYRVGMTADQLFTHYTDHGEYPCIFRDGDSTLNVPFGHLQYAMDRCDHVCGAAAAPDPDTPPRTLPLSRP
jgi:hypothetical protein